MKDERLDLIDGEIAVARLWVAKLRKGNDARVLRNWEKRRSLLGEIRNIIEGTTE